MFVLPLTQNRMVIVSSRKFLGKPENKIGPDRFGQPAVVRVHLS